MPFNIAGSVATNMTLESNLVIGEVAVAGGSTDISFDWSGVTQDFFKHDFVPGNIKRVFLVPWDIPLADVQMGINTDDPYFDTYADAPAAFNPQASGTPVTSMLLTDLKDGGGGDIPHDILLDYMDPARTGALTLILQENVDDPGVDARMIVNVKPTAGETNTVVALTDTSSTLTATAMFGEPTLVPANQANILFDWGPLIGGERSFGGTFISEEFEIIIGKYPLDTDLEAGILDIDYVYENFWSGLGPAVGTQLNLSTLTDETDAAFPGIVDGDQFQYLLGIVCTTCVNPSPWYLTQLQTCP